MRPSWFASLLILTATPALADEPSPPPADEPPPADAPSPGPADEPARATDAATQVMVATGPDSQGNAVRSNAAYGESLSYVEPRSYAKDWLVAPPGWTFGGQMKFITADRSLFGEGSRLRFADLAVLRLESRITASRRVELSGALDVLAKQPDGGDEPLVQGGELGAKIATSRAVALTVGVSGGPTLGTDGLWAGGGGGVVHRSRIEQFIAFQVGAGASLMSVHRQGMAAEWQTDVTASSELVFHTPRGEWAMWGGLGLALPVVHSEGIDPSTRLDVRIGTVFAAVKDWDLYTEFTLRDRGTTSMPGTVLPIADGGFDQKQVVVGITRRFTERGHSRWALTQ